MSGLSQQELLKRIMEINKDTSLSDAEKAAARQDLMSGKWKQKLAASSDDTDKETKGEARLRHAVAAPPAARLPARHLRARHPASTTLSHAAANGCYCCAVQPLLPLHTGASLRACLLTDCPSRLLPAATFAAVPCPADDKGKGKAAASEDQGGSGLDDDTLKCAICFDLCTRPVTVRGAGRAGSGSDSSGSDSDSYRGDASDRAAEGCVRLSSFSVWLNPLLWCPSSGA